MAKRSRARKQSSGTEAEIVLPELPSNAEVAQTIGAPIDGTEDDTTELEQNNPAPVASDVGGGRVPQAVAAAVNAVKKAANKRVKVEPMAEISKAELIRNEIASRKAAGEEKIRPRDIVAALADKGVKVHAPQVSVAIRDFGKTKSGKPATTIKSSKLSAAVKKNEKGKRVLARVKATPAAAPTSSGVEPRYADLMTASTFVSGVGGLDKARELLDAYARIANPAK